MNYELLGSLVRLDLCAINCASSAEVSCVLGDCRTSEVTSRIQLLLDLVASFAICLFCQAFSAGSMAVVVDKVPLDAPAAMESLCVEGTVDAIHDAPEKAGRRLEDTPSCTRKSLAVHKHQVQMLESAISLLQPDG